MASSQPILRHVEVTSAVLFLLASVLVVALVTTDRYTSTLLPAQLWSALHMMEFPYKMTVLVLFLTTVATCFYYFASRAPDPYVLLIIITLIALQTNGIKLGVDVITMMPFVVILFLLAESLRRPSFHVVVPGVMFFGILLLMLDVPFMTATHIYPPPRFLINFISILKGVLVAFIFVNLIRTERHLDITIRAFLVVAFVSAMIGVVQIALNYFTGAVINFATEQAERKPNLLGMTLRATGFTTWASWLSDFLVLAMPFMLFRFFNARSFRQRARYAFAILVLLAAIFFTFTYAAYFAVALILAIFPFLYWPRKSIHFLVTLLFVGGLFQVAGGWEWVYEKGLTKVMQSTGMVERKVYLQSTLHEIARDPWIGSGVYAEEEFSENSYRKRVHNAGVQAWAALGLPGLLIFMTMMLTVLTQLWLMASATRGQDRQLFQALGLGVIAMILEMFAEPNLTLAITWFYLGLCQAALLVYCTWRYPRRVAPIAGPALRPA